MPLMPYAISHAAYLMSLLIRYAMLMPPLFAAATLTLSYDIICRHTPRFTRH